MSDHGDARAEEIVIIRRRHGDDDHGHHGGAWKIAYADFMTAMMALFLVMWLINASNTETKASVAAYFSPIKLTDSVSRTKGLQDPVDKATQKGAAAQAGGTSAVDSKVPAAKKAEEKAVQDGKAKGAGQDGKDKPAKSGKPSEETARAGSATEAGRAFRDPFNPRLPDQSIARDGTGKAAGTKELAAVQAPPAQVGTAAQASTEVARPAELDQAAKTEAKRLEAKAASMLSAVQAAVAQSGTQTGPAIDVRVENGGLVLSLTDTSTFGMFAIGSADPNASLTRLMQSIAPLVLANGNKVVVRGHTDGRPYRNDRNNNWRLSMARAEAAMQMLVRSRN